MEESNNDVLPRAGYAVGDEAKSIDLLECCVQGWGLYAVVLLGVLAAILWNLLPWPS